MPTGFQVASCESEKKARILIKRLFTKVRSSWRPSAKLLDQYIQWRYDTLKILRTAIETKTTCVNYQDVTDTDEDIPF